MSSPDGLRMAFAMRERLYNFDEAGAFDRILLLTDSNVRPLLPSSLCDYPVMEVKAGEASKSLDVLAGVWRRMVDEGMTRRSLLVNIGGGVVTDLGGFAASTFKRGIAHINVPTTLLGMADAAIGGKTGIDFAGAKNEIGSFHMPLRVIVDPEWLATLPQREILNGMAEVVKSLLLDSDPEGYRLYESLITRRSIPDTAELGGMASMAASFKQRVVAEDPHEKGLRKILNFGHTAGHAFESIATASGTPLGHGEAVAWGMLFALILSEKKAGLAKGFAEGYRKGYLEPNYAPLPEVALSVEKVIGMMGRDKKNARLGEVSMVLLEAPGMPVTGISVTPREIGDTLEEMLPMSR